MMTNGTQVQIGWLGRSVAAALFILLPAVAQAETTSADEAAAVVRGWLSQNAQPLNAELGEQISKVQTYTDPDGIAEYYVVVLDPAGFVIVPADDNVEPIIAFSPDGTYEPDPDNPLTQIIESDVPRRVAITRDGEPLFAAAGEETPAQKWERYLAYADGGEQVVTALTSLPDTRVDEFVLARWSQSNEGGDYCYNYYTPGHYVCGCVATAMAQVMRYHQYPTTGIGQVTRTVEIDGTPTSKTTRGGDGSGGAYNWANMPLDPSASASTAQRQAIGAICYDAGVAAEMMYTASSSGAYLSVATTAMRDIFKFSNSVYDYASSGIPAADFNKMVNPNLDAGYPCMLGITGDGGHAIVCDGYGYSSSTLYHHLNFGWGNSGATAWYNLPTIGTAYNFDTVSSVSYNMFPDMTGEVISGRVVDGNDNPLSGVAVAAVPSGGGSTFNDTTDANGIFAFAGVLSNKTYTITPTNGEWSFTPQQVTTGTSADYVSVGNVWGVDFSGAATYDSAELTSHSDGDTISGSSTVFAWDAGTDVDEYFLRVGSTETDGSYCHKSFGLTRQATVLGWPTNGATVYVSLYSRHDDVWVRNDYTLTTAAGGGLAATLTSHSDGDALTGSATLFTWSTGTNPEEYWLNVGRTAGGTEFFGGSTGLTREQLVNGLPIDGSDIYVSLYTKVYGQWVQNTYTFTGETGSGLQSELTSHADGDTLAGATVQFTWQDASGNGAEEYWLSVGSTASAGDYFFASTATNTTQLVTDLPTDGSTVYLRLYTRIGNTWIPFDYQFTAGSGVGLAATLTSHSDGDTFTGSTQRFAWTDESGNGAEEYWLAIGSSLGAGDYFFGTAGTATSRLINGLPADGSTVYLRLRTRFSGIWTTPVDYQFTNNAGAGLAAVLTSHSDGDTLNLPYATFGWNDASGNGGEEYWLNVGTTPGAGDIFSGSTGTSTSQYISGYPVDGSTFYLRLYTRFGSTWARQDYQFDCTVGASPLAELTSHTTGDVIDGYAALFEWNLNDATEVFVRVGTTLGSGDIATKNYGTNTSAIIRDLPTDGSTIYLRLYSRINGEWLREDYNFTAQVAPGLAGEIDSHNENDNTGGNPLVLTWTAGTSGEASQFFIKVGDTSGSSEYCSKNTGTGQTITLNGLPTDGRDLHVWVYTMVRGVWVRSERVLVASN